MPAVHRDWVEYVKRKCKLSYKNQRELGGDAGVSRDTASNFLNSKNVSAENFQSLCDALGLDSERERLTQPKQNQDAPPSTIPNTPNPAPTNLSRYCRTVPKFVGRGVAMRKVTELVEQCETVAIAAAVSGMGGLGKTELAWQWADQKHRDGEFPGGVVWLDMAAGNPGEQLVLFCQTEFGVELPELPTLEERVDYCWRHWTEWRSGVVLVVLDDVARDRDGAKLTMLKPGPGTFRVLWTTRERWSGVKHYSLDQLSAEAARELLGSYFDPARLDTEPAAVTELLAWFEGLPLGLELAARYLALDEFLPIADYVAQLSLTHESLARKPEEMDYPHGVEAALMLSWARLASDEARRLALRLGLYGAAPIPLTTEEQRDWHEALRRLVNLNLVARDAADRVRLHPLVRQFLRGRLVVDLIGEAVDELKREVAGAIAAQGKQIPYPITVTQVQEFAPWIPHLEEVVDELLPWVTDADVIEPFNRIAWYYEGQGLYSSAETLKEKCVAVVWERLDEQHPDILAALNNLATFYVSQGKHNAAELLFLQALEINRANLSPPYSKVALLNNLANLYKSQGKYDAAELLFLQALEINRANLSPLHPTLAISLNNLAEVYRIREDYDTAEPFYLEAIEIDRVSLPPNHPDLAVHLNNIALLYECQRNYSAAEPFYLEALEIVRTSLPPNHLNLASVLNNLATLYKFQGDYNSAEPLHLESLSIRVQSLPEAHPSLSTGWNNVLDFYRTALAAGHPDTRLNQYPLGDQIRAHL